jgi:CheY-like chemotaxis protein
MSPESFAILIAAGEPAMRQLIRTTLTATGFHLEETSSAQSALEMTRKGGFDLVLLDLNVPDKGGADACRRLRAQSPALGIIVVRADANGSEKTGSKKNPEEDEWRMIEAGADDCVTAPFRYPGDRSPHGRRAAPSTLP